VLAAELGLEENLTAVDEAVSYAQKLGPMLGTIEGVTVQPEVPQAAMFHLHIEGDADTLIGKITRHAELESVIVLPLPRATVGHSSVFEISVGRRTMAEPPEFWLTHLAKCRGR
jgi:hypothetical protein